LIVLLVLLVWRGHSCPRDLATGTNSEFRSGTSTARNFRCATDSCHSEGIVVGEAIPHVHSELPALPIPASAATLSAGRRPPFVTFRTSPRFTLSCQARRLFLQHCFHDNGKTIHLHAVVVMPDHVHLLFTALRMRTVGLSLCRKSFGPSRRPLRAASIT
jgi:hypothetical protein